MSASEKLAADALLILQQLGGILPNEAPDEYDPGRVEREDAGTGFVSFSRTITYRWKNRMGISFELFAGTFEKTFSAPPRGLASWEIDRINLLRPVDGRSFPRFGAIQEREIADTVAVILQAKNRLLQIMIP